MQRLMHLPVKFSLHWEIVKIIITMNVSNYHNECKSHPNVDEERPEPE